MTTSTSHGGPSVEELRAYVAETRAAQGLPPTITDPAVLATVARMILTTRQPQPATSTAGSTAA